MICPNSTVHVTTVILVLIVTMSVQDMELAWMEYATVETLVGGEVTVKGQDVQENMV